MDYINYEEYNDFELLAYICENNEEANDIIFRKYEPLIITTAKKYYNYCKNTGVQLNDLIQEGMLSLNKAINNFDEQKDVLFYSFAKLCIERGIMGFVVRLMRHKCKPLNNYISLELLSEDNNKLNKIIFKSNLSPEELIIDKETEINLNKQIKKFLTPMEKQVFELKLGGYSYNEISKILNRSKKSIDGALHRIRLKVRKVMNELTNKTS